MGDVCQHTRKAHEVVFFLAIYLISVGTGGHKPSLESFGADQFDDDHTAERKKKMSFNWWNFGLCSGLLLGVTVLVYVQDHVIWGAGAIILTAVMAMSLLLFIIGTWKAILSLQRANRKSIDAIVSGSGRRHCKKKSHLSFQS
ncbi:hypothetical protein LWI28_000824 [Acer negundo]|uniref:Uncharacterized protein n=1 Tax=Acer negundo TaxID=4023 RepID=A0AAD5I517_ACENE|nr:hypothetical protein LWI28_000824 [Acer negundo]